MEKNNTLVEGVILEQPCEHPFSVLPSPLISIANCGTERDANASFCITRLYISIFTSVFKPY